MPVFNLREQRTKIASSSPMHGPWYLVYNKPNWAIKAYPIPCNSDYSILHPDLWDTIAPSIDKFYGISDPSVSKKVMSLAYGMPRGRIVYRPNEPKQPFLFCYANDLKTVGLNFEIIKKGILSKFNLTEMFLAGKVRFVVDEHESMEPYEHTALMEIMNAPKAGAKPLTPMTGPTKKERGEQEMAGVVNKAKDIQWKNRTSD